jgi:hypothetical protein
MEHNKSRFARSLEIAVNLSIVIVALVGATVLVKNYLLRPTVRSASQIIQSPPDNPQAFVNNARPRSGPAEGTKLSVPGVDWGESSQTIVLALSNKCHFCTESAPFYQRLAQELAARKDVRLVAVLPQEAGEAKKYLEQLGVQIEQVSQASLGSIGVAGTPTLVIVDKAGVVKQSWMGRLSPEKESEVLSRVKA